jgi:hypothetical protein
VAAPSLIKINILSRNSSPIPFSGKKIIRPTATPRPRVLGYTNVPWRQFRQRSAAGTARALSESVGR